MDGIGSGPYGTRFLCVKVLHVFGLLMGEMVEAYTIGVANAVHSFAVSVDQPNNIGSSPSTFPTPCALRRWKRHTQKLPATLTELLPTTVNCLETVDTRPWSIISIHGE